MLKNIPKILSPDLLKLLNEMGHNDVLVIGDGNFPGTALAKAGEASLVRYDAAGVVDLLDAILTMIPLDTYVEKPVLLMQKEPQDKDIDIPIWDEISNVIRKHGYDTEDVIGFIDRFTFYNDTKKAYTVIQSGEEAIYACIMIRKGVIK